MPPTDVRPPSSFITLKSGASITALLLFLLLAALVYRSGFFGGAPKPDDKSRQARATLANPDAPPKEVASALLVLAQRHDPQVGPKIAEAARSANAELRGGAARAAGALGNDEDLPLLEQLLSDADPKVREAAITGLADHAHPAQEALLKETLKRPQLSGPEHVRLLYARARVARYLEDRMTSAEEILALAQRSSDEKVKLAALRPIAELAPKKGKDFLQSARVSGSPALRSESLKTLKLACPPDRIHVLEKALRSEPDFRTVEVALSEASSFVDPRLTGIVQDARARRAKDKGYRAQPFEAALAKLSNPARKDPCSGTGD